MKKLIILLLVFIISSFVACSDGTVKRGRLLNNKIEYSCEIKEVRHVRVGRTMEDIFIDTDKGTFLAGLNISTTDLENMLKYSKNHNMPLMADIIYTPEGENDIAQYMVLVEDKNE